MPSDSSASITKRSSDPVPLETPSWAMTPPLTKVGAASSSCRAVTSMPVDVVLPCAPAIETSRRPPMSQCSACERWMTGIPRSFAVTNSGFSGQMAPVWITVSASPRFAASCPTCTRAPRAASSRSAWLSARSDPETRMPRSRNMRASPDMPEPPMPMKCAASMDSGMGRLRSGLIMTHQA